MSVSNLTLMKKNFLIPAISVLFLVGCAARLVAQPATQKKLEPWQTDWKLYVAELGRDLQKGVDPGEDGHLKDKTVEFEGTLREAFDPAKPDQTLDIEMDDAQEVTVMLKLFPGVNAEKAGDKTGTVKLKKIMVKPAETSRDAWKAITNGSRVRFRARVDHDAAVLVTTNDIGGLVFLFLQSAELLPSK
jgi:hypothetical protein